MLLTNRCFWRY